MPFDILVIKMKLWQITLPIFHLIPSKIHLGTLQKQHRAVECPIALFGTCKAQNYWKLFYSIPACLPAHF
jgi:hypothetical protein